ncbi:MAG: hypothetical protein HZB57_06735 [Gammaproteobacteria bacterium]|nr:hypothetical protein [Gammaproteobacteria bacterium]
MTRIDQQIPRSVVNGIGWPALPDANAAGMLALQQQLAQSQWWSPEIVCTQQQTQLMQVLAHALDTIPAYAQRFQMAGLEPRVPALLEAWLDIPILKRSELRMAGETFMSQRIPPEHGKLSKVQTSGSTGTPITAYGTRVTALFWRAFTLREHLWQCRDLSGRFAAIRPEGTLLPGRGQRAHGWGPATDVVYASGESFTLSSRTDIPTQAAWLQEVRPDYLLSLPSNLIALARHCRERGIALPNLREVRSYGEVAGDELRQLCRAVWGVEVKDMYSAQEVGYMALQCPEHAHYHVMSEGVRLEVLDAAGRQCAPGERIGTASQYADVPGRTSGLSEFSSRALGRYCADPTIAIGADQTYAYRGASGGCAAVDDARREGLRIPITGTSWLSVRHRVACRGKYSALGGRQVRRFYLRSRKYQRHRRMSRILCVWELGGGYGHIAALAPLAQALRVRGHEVTLVLKDLFYAEAILGTTGLDYVQAPVW